MNVQHETALREIARSFLAGAGMTIPGELARVTGLPRPDAGRGNRALVAAVDIDPKKIGKDVGEVIAAILVDEGYTVTLSNAGNATISDATGAGTSMPPSAAITGSAESLSEDNSPTRISRLTAAGCFIPRTRR